MDNKIKKRIPANTSLEFPTFLNDRKIDGELYAFLQQISTVRNDNETVIDKYTMPTQRVICDAVGIKSPKTLRGHLQYLINAGYIVEEENFFVLPNKEEFYFLIPLETIKYLNDTLKEQVIKIYVYLGQRYQYAQSKGDLYQFTLEEIASHIGYTLVGNPRGYETVYNALDCLRQLGLIDYVDFHRGMVPYKRLTKFSLQVKTLQ